MLSVGEQGCVKVDGLEGKESRLQFHTYCSTVSPSEQQLGVTFGDVEGK